MGAVLGLVACLLMVLSFSEYEDRVGGDDDWKWIGWAGFGVLGASVLAHVAATVVVAIGG